MNLFLFGDQTDDARTTLRALLQTELDPLLQCFVERSYQAIRTELLPPLHVEDRRDWGFSSLLELLDLELPGTLKVALDHAITTICHFGLFFKRCHESGGIYPRGDSTNLIGLCTGSLAAAAISCCRALSELLPVAVEVSVLSFRTGVLAAETGARLECGSSESEESWAIAIPGLDDRYANTMIDGFIETKRTAKTSRPYVGVSSCRGLTICGPPYVLSSLCAENGRMSNNVVKLPIYAPYHAAHLYTTGDIESLLSRQEVFQSGSLTQLITILPRHDNGTGSEMSLKETLREALNAILLERVDWGNITKDMELTLQLSRSTAGNATLIPIASGAGPSILKSLNADTRTRLYLADPILPQSTDERSGTAHHLNSSRSKIAIVGASGRFPSAKNLPEFWDLLREGQDVHRVVPTLRWDVSSHVDTSKNPRKNTSGTPYGCWINEPGLFDAKFFGMSPREAEQVDPAQRLALMTAYEALEDGGIIPGMRSTQSDRVGVAYGVTSNDWMETNSAQDIDTYLIPGGNRAFIPGRINYFFKFTGPSYAIDTACSSSLAAIHVACNVLWRREADMMIAGGTNIITNPDFTAGLDRGRFLSRTGNCKTFDDEADGYCRGEGVGTVILKRLEDAILDNDTVKGVIVNVCTNHSAEAESITRPNLKAQRDIFTKVLDGLSPLDVTYVEMHGTGTQVGDATEMSSVLEAIAPKYGSNRRLGADFAHIGSVKANVGHGEAAAGVTSLIKLLLMMKHNIIPPHIGIRSRINHKFPSDMKTRGVRIATKPVDWDRSGQRPRHALLNNFSAAGGNTTLLLQDAPLEAAHTESDPRPTHPITVSAKTFSALEANGRALIESLQEGFKYHLSSLSYTTTARRMHHAHRIAVNGSSWQEIASKLSTALQNQTGKTRAILPSIIFAFTGQGSHYVGMGRDLYLSITSFKGDMDRYDQLACSQGFSSFLPIVRDSEGDVSSFSSEVTQLAITCLQMALARLWISWGIVPSCVIGHSLGHYAALNIAGVISEADAIYLIGIRARALQEKCQPGTHSMLAVKASQSSVAHLLAGTAVDVACVNGPEAVTLSGTHADIELVRSRLSSKRMFAKLLDVPYAFHSSQVDRILQDIGEATLSVEFCAPRIPVLCPRTEQVVRRGGVFGPAHLVDHCRGSVNFLSAVQAGKTEKVITERTVFLEIGPDSAVTSMLKAILTGECKVLPSLRKDQRPWKPLVDAVTGLYMTGLNIKWDQYHHDFAKNNSVVPLPPYKWDYKNYWIKYTHDWTLRKGDPPQVLSLGPDLLTTTIHSRLYEEVRNLRGTIILRSDLSKPVLRSVVQGHKVNNIPLCTPSIYADIALTVGQYLQENNSSALNGKQISIDNMTIQNALIAQSNGPQWLQTEVKVNASRTECEFSTVHEDGSTVVKHATCSIVYTETDNPERLEEQACRVRKEIDQLRHGLATERCYRFNRSMIYRMVATLADFDPDYRGLQEIVLDNASMAAASKVDFTGLPLQECGTYAVHPAYVDSLSQSAGFIMNGHEASDLRVECFVNHGWESFKLHGTLCRDKVYESYVKMVKGEANIWRGTLTVVHNEKLVAVFEGIKLQGVSTRLLYHVLATANKAQSTGREHIDLSQHDVHHSQSRVDAETKAFPEVNLDLALAQIVDIVAEESGIDKADLHDDTEFALLGIDSLLSLLITSRLKEKLDYDIGPSFSIFDHFSTLGQLKHGYAKLKGQPLKDSLKASTTGLDCAVHEEVLIDSVNPGKRADSFPDETSPLPGPDTCSAGPATSLVLQKAETDPPEFILFLFPDGSGSPSSYASLPTISRTVTLISLICPYRRNPEAMTHSLDALISSYIAEIKKRQPKGEYCLGGWSSGGIMAYRAAQMLLDSGAKVRNLIMIDSPPPNNGLERLPARFYKHCSDVGVFNQIGSTGSALKVNGSTAAPNSPPGWLIPHFNATIELLASYRATPLFVPQEVVAPRCSLCWAEECALDGVRYPKLEHEGSDGEGMRFLTERRTAFGPEGWAELLTRGQEWRVEVLRGFDHFNMMYGEGAEMLRDFIERALT